MSFCTVCLKDSKEHSEKLWEMHQSAIQEALKKTRHKKLWTKKMGFGPDCPAVLDNDFSWDGNLNPAEWLHPIHVPCAKCGLYLGRIEENNADVLDGMCLECFSEVTEQEGKSC